MARTQDQYNISQDLLYPLDDPTEAFRNAMQDIGINPFRSNPFVEQMKKFSQASRISYLADRAFNPGAGGVRPEALPGEGYGQYLRGQLQNGTLLNTTYTHSDPAHYKQILDRVRGYQDQIAAGGTNPGEISPYMAALNDIFSAQGGRGALAAYGSLRSPLMGSLAPSYTRSLADFGDAAMRRFAQEGGVNDDPWRWLFNNGARSAF